MQAIMHQQAPYILGLDAVLAALPVNTAALSIRRVSRAFRARLAAHTVVVASQWAPLWAIQERWERFAPRQQDVLLNVAFAAADRQAAGWMADPTRMGALPDTASLLASAGWLPELQRLSRAALLEWAWELEDVSSAAARAGHIEVLEWLRQDPPRGRWRWDTCAAAACAGRLEVLVWLRAQDPPCPWKKASCLRAAEHPFDGDVDAELVAWIRSQV